MIQLILGDAYCELPKIAENSIDLTVTSPPYDNLRTYNSNNAQWGEPVWKGIIEELYTVTKPGGVVVWVDHIISWSNEGDTVLDPFMGSGTTGKMARQLGRNFIGIELDEQYYNIAKERIGI